MVYAGFAELPAQIDLLVAQPRREVDQPRLQVLDHAAGVLDLVDEALHVRGAAPVFRAHLGDAQGVDLHAAAHGDLSRDLGQLGLPILELETGVDGLLQQAFEPRQQSLGLLKREVVRHSVVLKKRGPGVRRPRPRKGTQRAPRTLRADRLRCRISGQAGASHHARLPPEKGEPPSPPSPQYISRFRGNIPPLMLSVWPVM